MQDNQIKQEVSLNEKIVDLIENTVSKGDWEKDVANSIEKLILHQKIELLNQLKNKWKWVNIDAYHDADKAIDEITNQLKQL